jgi:hypothetical protein
VFELHSQFWRSWAGTSSSWLKQGGRRFLSPRWCGIKRCRDSFRRCCRLRLCRLRLYRLCLRRIGVVHCALPLSWCTRRCDVNINAIRNRYADYCKRVSTRLIKAKQWHIPLTLTPRGVPSPLAPLVLLKCPAPAFQLLAPFFIFTFSRSHSTLNSSSSLNIHVGTSNLNEFSALSKRTFATFLFLVVGSP